MARSAGMITDRVNSLHETLLETDFHSLTHRTKRFSVFGHIQA